MFHWFFSWQIEFYKTKYRSFNKTMADSNRLFDSAKEEMEKVSFSKLQ